MCKSLILVAHLFTAHGGTYDYNDNNTGAGLECRGELFSVQAGTYHNSFHKRTLYVVGGIEPIRTEHFALGIAAGPATGYAKFIDTPVIGGVRARFTFGRFEASVLALPKLGQGDAMAHLMIGYRIGSTSFKPRPW